VGGYVLLRKENRKSVREKHFHVKEKRTSFGRKRENQEQRGNY